MAVTAQPRTLTPELMDELRSMLGERGARAEKLWRPPIDADAVAAQIERLGLTLPAELKVWWSRHDGLTNALWGTFGQAWWPMPVDEAVKATVFYRKVAKDIETAPAWPRSWIAFAFDGSHGSLACDSAVGPGEPSPVHMHFTDDSSPEGPALPSMGELVLFWIEALKDGTLRVSKDGGFLLLEPSEKGRARGPLADLL